MSERERRAEVVTLCGSTKFKDAINAENARLTMAGSVVISLGLFGHTDLPDYDWTTDATDLKAMLDRLHFQKIDMADRVHVVNVGGYYGESTAREIAYARRSGKPVTFTVEEGNTMSDTTEALEAELRATEIPLAVLSRGNEPPVGTWVRDRHGAVSYRQKGGGWGEPGIMPFGVWTAMWDARGPYVLCGPWGAPTPAESVLSRAADALAAARTENDDLKKWWGRSVRATKKREAERDEARAALAEANRKIELALMNLHGREYAEDCDDMIVVIDGAQKALRGELVTGGNTDV